MAYALEEKYLLFNASATQSYPTVNGLKRLYNWKYNTKVITGNCTLNKISSNKFSQQWMIEFFSGGWKWSKYSENKMRFLAVYSLFYMFYMFFEVWKNRRKNCPRLLQNYKNVPHTEAKSRYYCFSKRKVSFRLIVKINSQARCKFFHPITMLRRLF